MACHELAVSEEDAAVVYPAAESELLLYREVLDRIEQSLLAGDNVGEELLEHASRMMSETCGIEERFIELCIREYLYSAETYSILGEESIALDEHRICIIEVVNALITEENALVLESDIGYLFKWDIRNERQSDTLAGAYQPTEYREAECEGAGLEE